MAVMIIMTFYWLYSSEILKHRRLGENRQKITVIRTHHSSLVHWKAAHSNLIHFYTRFPIAGPSIIESLVDKLRQGFFSGGSRGAITHSPRSFRIWRITRQTSRL